MADILSHEDRSKLMSRIKSKNTAIEIIVRKWLFSHGFRYRINVKELPGSPDIVLKKYKCVIFVNGCFWHGHNCLDGHLPKTNKEFWKNKIKQNVERDSRNIKTLTNSGWHVITIWECELKDLDQLMNRVSQEIQENPRNTER